MEEKKKLFTHVKDGNDEIIKSGEDIIYLVLIDADWKYEDNAETFRSWEFITGRQAAYDYIKGMIVNEGVDDVDVIVNVDKSLIYADNPHVAENKMRLSNGITVYQFMKDMFVLRKVDDDSGFCIDDYHQEEIDGGEIE